MQTSLDLQSLGNLVRSWVHYDTLTTNFNKQLLNTRKERDVYEKQIIQTMKNSNYEKAVIQISGGKLLLTDEKHSQPLTFSSLQELLHEYFKHSAPGKEDQTAAILKFIKENRTVTTGVKLKKIMTPG
jgi:CRISPR/Cas system CSM-associated protein Csm2 small subunit